MFSSHCVHQSILLYAKGYLSRFIPPLMLNITNVYQVKCLAPGMDYKWPWVHILKPVTSFIRWLPQWFKGVTMTFFLFLCFSGKIIWIKNLLRRVCIQSSAYLQRGSNEYPPYKNRCLKHINMGIIVSIEAQVLNRCFNYCHFLFIFFCNWGHLSKKSWKNTTKRF